MSFPYPYASPVGELGVPSSVLGNDQKVFSGAKSTVRSVASDSGSGSGPSSSILFSIPCGALSFLKPNSMYLRCKVEVAQVVAAGNTWGFAGNSLTSSNSWGGASSLINRINVMLPGGSIMTYNNYNHFRNAVLPHALTTSYIYNDLRQLEYVGVNKLNTTAATALSRQAYVSIPLFIPLFCNANQAFPLLLLPNGSNITLEILTETVNNAIYATTTAVTGYTISEASLVYETIDVPYSFKEGLLASKAGQQFLMHVNDYWSVGPVSTTQSVRYAIGCGLSSLKGVVATEQLANDISATTNKKKYASNALSRFNVMVDGQYITIGNIDNDAVSYAEMNRALGRLNDPNMQSFLEVIATSTAETGLRNTYSDYNFLIGATCQVVDDWGFNSGIPASNVMIELDHSPATDAAVRWQNSTAYAASNLYVWLLNDTTVAIDVGSGNVTIRK
jgi:hypothetical protein